MRSYEFINEGGVKQSYLWHGSTKKIPKLEPRQAVDVGGAEGSNKHAIYATPDKNTAIKMGMAEKNSDTGMLNQNDQLILFKGKLRHGKQVYLHKLPRYDADGKDMWLPGGNSNEFYTKSEIKELKPLQIISTAVDQNLKLVRKPTKKDLELRKYYLNKSKQKNNSIKESVDNEAEKYKAHLIKTLPLLMNFLSKTSKDYLPTEDEMLDVVETGYEVMLQSGDKNKAGEAVRNKLKSLISKRSVVESLYVDVPNEDWLQDKIDYTKSKGRDKFGAPFFTSTTAYFKQNVRVPIQILRRLPGIEGEQQNVRSKDLMAIKKIMKNTGKLPMHNNKEYVPFVRVAYNGEAWVFNGNHRIMAAAELFDEGDKRFSELPINLSYHDGGERVKSGVLSPEKIGNQNVMEGSYREGGSITHDGVEYDFDSVMSIAEKMPTKSCPVDKLSWVLQYDTPNKERLERADITVPLIVTKSVNGKLAAIDGLHRLAKAVRDNVKTLPVKYIKPSELESAKLNKQGVTKGKDSIPSIGINIRNDGDIDYASLIVDGKKKYESRKTDSLRPYVGKTVAIVRTGSGHAVAIGQVTIGEPIVVNAEKFDKLRKQHLVPQGSKFDIVIGDTKYLYPMINPKRWDNEKVVHHKGIVSRKIQEQGVAEDTDHGNNQPLRLRANTGRVQKFIEAVYARYPQTFQNNHVMSWGEGEAQQLALFELVPSMSKRDAVDVKWFQAYPLRQGVGSRAMRVLQDMAREDGISLTLYPWDKGQISQTKLIKFYKSHGFKPTMKGSKNMVWEPVNEQGVAEVWSEKYKRSINCKNPKGFSQRAHCQGRKKRGKSK